MLTRRFCSSDNSGSVPTGTGSVDLMQLESLADHRILLLNRENDFRRLMDVSFQNFLTAFFERQYWRRLWIIQEIAVASRTHVLCGNVSITLHDLEKAISCARESQYWHPAVESGYFYFGRIMEIRSLYQTERLSLCRAIFLS
jgi:hypothetical protein